LDSVNFEFQISELSTNEPLVCKTQTVRSGRCETISSEAFLVERLLLIVCFCPTAKPLLRPGEESGSGSSCILTDRQGGSWNSAKFRYKK